MSLYPAFVQASTLSFVRSYRLNNSVVSTIDLLSFEVFESTPLRLGGAVLVHVQTGWKQPAVNLLTAANNCVPSVQ